MSYTVALFDFDGTLTRKDSLFLFLLHLKGFSGLLIDTIKASPWLIAYGIGFLKNDIAKEKLLTVSIGGMKIKDLQLSGDEFARNHLPAILRNNMISILQAHQKQRHFCVLVSASIDVYLKPWSEQMGFDSCLCSLLMTDDSGKATGRLMGSNCYGVEKTKRVTQLLQKLGKPETIYAYGDSKGDYNMFALADKAYLVGKKVLPFTAFNNMR